MYDPRYVKYQAEVRGRRSEGSSAQGSAFGVRLIRQRRLDEGDLSIKKNDFNRLFSARRFDLFEVKLEWQVSGSSGTFLLILSSQLTFFSFFHRRFPSNRHPMEHHDAQHQQKGFLNNLFISELGADRGNESHHLSMYSTSGALPSPSPPTMSPPNSVIPNVPLNLDLVSQLIGLQGQQANSIGQGQYSPQLVLEQRLKLNQLQQLQLQSQILQQQVSRIMSTSLIRSHPVNSVITDVYSSNS
jgi:hypothetical protein